MSASKRPYKPCSHKKIYEETIVSFTSADKTTKGTITKCGLCQKNRKYKSRPIK